MWITKLSPTAVAAVPLEDCSIPEASMATWPSGEDTIWKMAAGSAAIRRATSKRSTVMNGILARRSATRSEEVVAREWHAGGLVRVAHRLVGGRLRQALED